MEPPSDATPPTGPREPDAPGEQEPPAWRPPDSRPGFAPPEPVASWPAGHTYPVQPPPPEPEPWSPGPPAPGYLLPGQVAPGAGPGVPGHPGPSVYPGYPGYVMPQREPWTVQVPAGTPFHQMDRTERHRWWRPLLGTVALLGGIVAMVVVVLIVWVLAHRAITGEFPAMADPERSGTTGEQLLGGPLEDLAFQLVLLGVLIPLVPLTVWIFQRRPMGTVVSVLGRMRWRWLGVCALAALGYVAVSYATGAIVTAVFTDEPVQEWAGWERFWPAALVILLLVPFQSTAEEFLFRGWALQAVGGCTLRRPDGTYRNALTGALGRVFGTPWPAILISSAVFVAGHGYRGWAMLDIFIWALACGWLAVRTGGLEAPIALHVFNNLFAFGVSAASGELESALQQGAAPWYYLLSDLPPLAVFVAVVLWLRRRMDVATATPA